jgi:peroxiredoxin
MDLAEPLAVGDLVRDFVLPGVDGTDFDTRLARSNGLLMFVFWKQGCGTCCYSMPFLQRFHDLYSGNGFQICGISQENRENTLAFMDEYSLTFQQALDENLEVTEKYRLITVPGVYLVDSSERILCHSAAFVTDEFNEIARIIANRTSKPYMPVVRPEDDAPAIKPG